MDNKILEMMEAEIQHHEDEIDRIRAAIQAYKGVTAPKPNKAKKTVKWKSEVWTLLLEGRPMDFEEIRDTLAKKGIDQANTAKGRSAIATTLNRMVSNEEVRQADDKKYERIPMRRRRPIQEAANSHEAQQ
jgi:hypothetical protein